jgi:hypothetical protein
MQSSRQNLDGGVMRSLVVGIGLSCLAAALVFGSPIFGSPMRADLGYRSLPVEKTSYAPLAQGPAVALTRNGDDECVRATKVVTTVQGPYGGLYVPRDMSCE